MKRALPLLFLLAACAELPEIEGTVSQAALDAPYPELVAIEPLLAEANAQQKVAPTDPLAARIARLQARADWLRRQRL